MIMASKLISFDLRADFGVLKKPDVNEGLQPTFNMLHRPALLGILGAIAGLEGYKEKGVFPEYYQKLKDMKIGIEPINHEKGNFTKTVIKYTNTVGYANKDGNLLVTEQTLRSPAYRCYLLLDMDNPLHQLLEERIRQGEAEYLPYIGKNECSAWWEVNSVKEYDFTTDRPDDSHPIATIFQRSGNRVTDEDRASGETDFDFLDFTYKPDSFLYFERLPTGFNERMFQYELSEFAYVNFAVRSEAPFENLYFLKAEKQYVSLF